MDGIEIRVARIRAGMKQYELAQQAGIHPSELSLIETGRVQPSAERLDRISRALCAVATRGPNEAARL